MTAVRRLSAACCYGLTPRGRACVAVVENHAQTLGSLSCYLHDVLVMCGSGVWFDQLQQRMSTRSLDQSLQSLLALGLIECLEIEVAPRRGTTRAQSTPSRSGEQMAYA